MKAKYSDSIEMTVKLIEDFGPEFSEGLDADELTGIIYDLLVGNRADLALPYFEKLEPMIDALIQDSISLNLRYGNYTIRTKSDCS